MWFAPWNWNILVSLGFWIQRRGFRIPGTGLHCLQWNLDCGFQWSVGFWIPWAVFPIPKARILDSTGKNFLDSLTWGDVYNRDFTGGGGCGGLSPTPPPHFSDGNFFLYFGYPDLSLTLQTRFSNLTILNTHKQRTDKLCLVAVTNEFVAPNDNRKGNFGHIQRIRLKNVWVTLNRCVCWV